MAVCLSVDFGVLDKKWLSGVEISIMVRNWFEEFFDSVALDFWREANSEEETTAEIHMIERLLELPRGGRILDLPCGLGRHLLGLASRGYQATGVDLSRDAVQCVTRDAAQAGLHVEVLHEDMRSIPWVSRFDGACCLGNSFGYFDRDGTDAFISVVARALKPAGRFLLESSMVAESLLPHLEERQWVRVGAFLLLVENDYRVSESRLDTQYTFVRNGEIHCRTAHHHVFTLAEIRRICESHQLSIEGLFASPELDPFELGSQRLFLLAEKRDSRKSSAGCDGGRVDRLTG